MRSIQTIRGSPPEKTRRKSSTMLVSAASGLWRDYKQKSEKPRHVIALEIVRNRWCLIVSLRQQKTPSFFHIQARDQGWITSKQLKCVISKGAGDRTTKWQKSTVSTPSSKTLGILFRHRKRRTNTSSIATEGKKSFRIVRDF